MSLKLTNRLTDKQKAMLQELDYLGSYDISMEEAGEIIDSLLEEQRLNRDEWEQDYYDIENKFGD